MKQKEVKVDSGIQVSNCNGFNCDKCDIRCLSNKNPKLNKFDENYLKEH